MFSRGVGTRSALQTRAGLVAEVDCAVVVGESQSQSQRERERERETCAVVVGVAGWVCCLRTRLPRRALWHTRHPFTAQLCHVAA